jgi:acetyl esterase/lipase
MVYIKTDSLQNVLKPVKEIPYCHQTIQTKWSFLPVNQIKLNQNEFMPHDLFWDNEQEDRIGIMILSHHKVNFDQLIEEYCLENELGNF